MASTGTASPLRASNTRDQAVAPSRSPNEISVGMILNSLEGPVAIAQCLDPSTKGCKRVEGCVARLLWKSLGEKIEEFLETVSLSDLLNEEIKLSG